MDWSVVYGRSQEATASKTSEWRSWSKGSVKNGCLERLALTEAMGSSDVSDWIRVSMCDQQSRMTYNGGHNRR